MIWLLIFAIMIGWILVANRDAIDSEVLILLGGVVAFMVLAWIVWR